ncbi:MAG: DUF4407 domain-containing protein [Methanomassiliicoccaceae archaeon]|jgi:uncharacterized membrane protein|nr:DUF4407 domain-containing protein [Methanomassiliicoccaceae archaeon]
MTAQKIAGILTTVLAMAIFGLFAWIFYTVSTAATSDDPGAMEGVTDNMFLMFGIFFALIVAIFIMNFIASAGKANSTSSASRTKKCAACGALIDVTEHSCPKCYSIQPIQPNEIKFIDHKTHNPKK